MSTYFDSVITNSIWRCKNPNDELSKIVLGSSSDWGTEHLYACHVVVSKKKRKYLPALQELSQNAEGNRGQSSDLDNIHDFIDGLSVEDGQLRQHELIHKVGVSLGLIWSALQDVKVTHDSDCEDIRDRPSRQSTATHHGPYVNSGTAIDPPSGTPPSSSPSQCFTSSPPAMAKTPVEDNSVHLASCVIRHILWYAQGQDADVVVEYRNRKRITFNIHRQSVTAIDDGGLCLRERDGTRSQESIAILEAKRRHEPFNSKPCVPDQVLAQMACEAIAARKDQDDSESIFIIHAAQNYMCFLQFDISDKQLQQIKEGKTPTDALKVHATIWFDLTNRSDRKYVVRNILGLVKFLTSYVDEDVSDDEEDDAEVDE
ncbi:hypothetical protein FAVG1_12829 [Fusarium avenaceum]|nr:hypothetical protein FAVG1_12829 [Fusarium avenaceum]